MVPDAELDAAVVVEVVGGCANRRPRHQRGGQWRLAGTILVNGAEFLFQKSPVDRPRQLHQRVVHVDDLIEPRTKQVLLAALPPLPWPHQILRSSRRCSTESWLEIRGNPEHQFARKSAPDAQFPANPIAGLPPISIANQPLQNISRTTL